MIETRKTEQRYVTSDPAKMLNMYLAKGVYKTWNENFIDEATQETITIERNELLFTRGTLIDQDTLAQIRFSMEADGIKEVEVSNQKRMAFENENKCLYPYIAQAQINDKKYKFLLYATGLENVIAILKDYIELNYQSGFTLTMAKEFDSCIILTDNLKERKVDSVSEAYLKDKISSEEYLDAIDTEDTEEESKPNEKKFYQIETKVTFDDEEKPLLFTLSMWIGLRCLSLTGLKTKRKNMRNKLKKMGMNTRRKIFIPRLNPQNLFRSVDSFPESSLWLMSIN